MRSLEALDITKDQLDGLLPKGLTPNMKWNIKTIEKELKALEIIKEIAKSYDIEFCDNNQTLSFKIMLSNKFILETITIKDKDKYDLLKEVL